MQSSGYRGGRGDGSTYRGRGRGRSSYNANHASHAPVSNESNDQGVKICTFYARGRSCRYGEGCRFSHHISATAVFKAHDQPVAAAGVVPSPFRILTGSKEPGIKVWSFDGESPREEVRIPTKGSVQRIEVVGNTVLWSSQEPLIADLPDTTVGSVHVLVDAANMKSIHMQRSESLPYTHPIEVGYFTTAVSGDLYVITGGGDTTIRTWKYDASKSTFEHIVLLEGHFRGITALVICESKLWSASIDTTIRIWDISSGRCEAVLSCLKEGHTAAVCCLKQIPPIGANPPYIASGGCDGKVVIWSLAGTHVFTLPLGDQLFVLTLEVFPNEAAGAPVLIAGLSDGRLVIISCRSMTILHSIDAAICSTQAVNCIAVLDPTRFLSAGDDGQLIIWQVEKPFVDPSP